MNCPKCDAHTCVKDTREKGDAVRRRRHCPVCGHRFSTLELTVEAYSKLSSAKRVAHAPSRRAVQAAMAELEKLL